MKYSDNQAVVFLFITSGKLINVIFFLYDVFYPFFVASGLFILSKKNLNKSLSFRFNAVNRICIGHSPALKGDCRRGQCRHQ